MKKFIIIMLMLFSLTSCAKPIIDIKESKGNPVTNTTEKLENELIVHFLNVGQGDSTFIELPNNKTMLIDGAEKKYATKIINYIKDLGYSQIDFILGTHPHADHIGGLSDIINTFDIGTIYMPKVVATSKTYENLLTTIKNKNLKIKTGSSGVEILSEENLHSFLVAPNKEKYSSLNNYSLVLKLVYGNTKFLFMGDAEELSENEINADISADVIKVGHHGSNTSTSAKFLAKVNPKYAIISVGENNSYNHPSIETIEKIKQYTNDIYRTDLNGTIIIKSNGLEINTILERN